MFFFGLFIGERWEGVILLTFFLELFLFFKLSSLFIFIILLYFLGNLLFCEFFISFLKDFLTFLIAAWLIIRTYKVLETGQKNKDKCIHSGELKGA